MSKLVNVLAVVAASSLLFGCGKPCQELEAKMCKDLGEADCKLWREKDKPGFPGTGSRPTKSCVNALGSYDTHMAGIKTILEAYKDGDKKVAEAKAKRDAKKAAKDADKDADKDDEPKKTAAGDSEECTALVDKICTDLGEATCKKWKEGDKPGLKANNTQCKMAMKTATIYKRNLKSVQEAVK